MIAPPPRLSALPIAHPDAASHLQGWSGAPGDGSWWSGRISLRIQAAKSASERLPSAKAVMAVTA